MSFVNARHPDETFAQDERVRAAFRQLSEVCGGHLQAACHVAPEIVADESLPTSMRRTAWCLLVDLHYAKTAKQVAAEEAARGLA
jgi:hypothetical protein